MKKILLVIFVTIFDPLTRIGNNPVSRVNPLLLLIIFGLIGYFGYSYIEQKNSDTNNDLMIAAESGDLPNIKNALGSGANLNYQDHIGRSPLHLAARYENLQAVQALLELGANPNAQDNKGRTPLHLARFDQGDNIDILKVLLEAGADPNIVDNKGRTALKSVQNQITFSHHRQKLLLQYGAIVF